MPTSSTVGDGVARLVEHHWPGARYFQHRCQPETLLLDLLCELGASGLQFRHGGINVVAHERDLMVLVDVPIVVSPAGGGMDPKFRRPRPEDQPASVRVDIRPLEDISKECPGCIGVVGINKGVNGSDHAQQCSRAPAPARPPARVQAP